MRIPIAAALLLASMASVSCGDSPTSPGGPAGLEGTWRATQAVFTSVAPPARSVNVVANGTVVTLVLVAGGSFTFTLAEPGLPSVVQTGTWSASIDVLTLTRSATDVSQFNMTWSGNNLTLTGGSALFQFTDGVPEEATLSMALVRQ